MMTCSLPTAVASGVLGWDGIAGERSHQFSVISSQRVQLISNINLCSNTLQSLKVKGQRTVGVPGDDGIRLQRNSNSELVDSSDSEDVLVVLDQPGADAGQSLALRLHDDPVEAAGLATLHNVMGDRVAAVLQRNLPGHRTFLLRHSADYDLISRRSRCV